MSFLLTTHHPLPTTRRQRRRGISLLEVLISMFVMMIGLLGVASLLPAGRFGVVEGSKLDRAGAIGRAAFRELKIRGMLQPQQGIDNSGNAVGGWLKVDGVQIEPQDGVPTDPGSPAANPTHYYSYAIDPWSIAVNTVDDPDQFPWAKNSITGAAAMKRVTLRPVVRPLLKTTPAMSLAMAEECFRSRDDLKFDLPKNTDKMAVQLFDRDGSSQATKRQWVGDYSWLATVSPNAPYNGHGAWTVSVVVFHKRPVLLRDPTGEAPPSERMANVTFVGGGDVILSTEQTGTNGKHFLDVRRGEWLMLCGPMPYRTATGNITVPTFRWYKIISADDTIPIASYTGSSLPGNPQYVRYVTLEGADWNADLTKTTAALFEGTIGVFEKNLKLETTSMWSN